LRISETSISGVFEAVTDIRQDTRGGFARLFCVDDLAAAQGTRPIKQINHSRTSAVGMIRGLHFQRPPMAEGKWIRCLRGRVFDVAVDLRRGSPTFLQSHSVELSAELMNAVFIPEGCAHGFQALAADSELLYLHTEKYSPPHEGGVRFDDPRLKIGWPLPARDISDRDLSHPLIDDAFRGISL
jgi:dTDP-4-dehydrorhamnose 3,5-epimerase